MVPGGGGRGWPSANEQATRQHIMTVYLDRSAGKRE